MNFMYYILHSTQLDIHRTTNDVLIIEFKSKKYIDIRIVLALERKNLIS